MPASAPAPDLVTLLGHAWRRPGAAAEGLADALRELVVDGRVPTRTRVPSERALAPRLGVSRGTVSRAYDTLRTDGYLTSARGAGSWLTLPGDPAPPGPGTPPELQPRRMTDLSCAALPAPPTLMAATTRATEAMPRHLAGDGYSATGLPEAREAIAARLTERGVATRADEILVTSGAQHALHLLLSVLCAPGDRVLVDAPAYPRTLSAIRRARIRAVSVPLTPAGWDVDAWSSALTAAGPRLAITVPDFHNPTGLTMTAAQREALAQECACAGTLLVADETLAELRLDGPRMPAPLAAHDPGAAVVTIGSMSKAAWGGLRLGWIRAAPSMVHELAVARADLDIASPVLDQLVAVELLNDWARVLEGSRAKLRARRDVLLEALALHAPGWQVRRPHGGMSTWVRLATPVATRLAAAAARERLLVTPGPAFSIDGTFERHIRLPFTAPPAQLQEAVATLATLAARLDPAEAAPAELATAIAF